MDKSQLYWLFLDFIGGESIDINGLYLKPERILRDGMTIEFSIQNPNNTSFYLGVIEEYLDDILFDFSKFTNHKFKIHVDTNYPSLYFNEKLKNDIEKVLKSITTIKLTRESQYHEMITEITGKSTGFNVEYDHDRIILWNEFDATSGITYNNTTGDVLLDNLGECIDYYLKTIESTSAYLESDAVYQELDFVFDEYPLIASDWVAQMYHTGFNNLS